MWDKRSKRNNKSGYPIFATYLFLWLRWDIHIYGFL
jgi:hypothetical protein